MRILLLWSIVACAAACAADATPPPDMPAPDPTAREYFDANVYPILAHECGGCHSTSSPPATELFVGRDAASTYDALTTGPLVDDYTSAAPLVHTTNSHIDMALTAVELDTILRWLSMEREERGL